MNLKETEKELRSALDGLRNGMQDVHSQASGSAVLNQALRRLRDSEKKLHELHEKVQGALLTGALQA